MTAHRRLLLSSIAASVSAVAGDRLSRASHEAEALAQAHPVQHMLGMLAGLAVAYSIVFFALGKLYPDKPSQACDCCRKTRPWAAEPLWCSCGGLFKPVSPGFFWRCAGLAILVLLVAGVARCGC
jgi:hypothetical protein